MYGCFNCMYVYTPYVFLELQMFVTFYVSTENQTHVLWKSSQGI